MLRELHLRNTGPSPQLDAEFAERLNVFTGDNGLGKSFLLDVVWWTLTGTWSGHTAAPYRPATPDTVHEASTMMFERSEDDAATHQHYVYANQEWADNPEHPDAVLRLDQTQPLVIYARVDGGISIGDPIRNQYTRGITTYAPQPLSAYHFTRDALWNGLTKGDRHLCNGLVHDWVIWQLQEKSQPGPFSILDSVLGTLSPSPTERMKPGAPVRVFRDDLRDYPTLVFPHGIVPIVHASAGMKRILGLAYALVWAWHEHKQAAALLRMQPSSSIVFLIDEVESHLHPQWQRRILPALLRVLSDLLQKGMHVQLMATTHAPLVLASLEPHFDRERDRLFHFGLESNQVTLREEYWAKEGDTSAWLTSDTFGLQQDRSVEAEQAIEAAKAWMRGERTGLPAGLDSEATIEAELRRVLPPGDDEFWPRWVIHTRGNGSP